VIVLDGSAGEGGGQILRSSLALSAITGQPFELIKIRARRARPGLMRQHLTSVRAAAKICGAEVEGDEIGSLRLSFRPGPVVPGTYDFAVGTAGSAMLVFQTVLPALLRAAGPSEVILEGGTHNPSAPPFDFLERSFLPLIARMGARFEAKLERPGFYPAGGGKAWVKIAPPDRLTGIELLDRGQTLRRRLVARVSRLPESVAERELRLAQAILGWDARETQREVIDPLFGPGNVLFSEIVCENVTEIVSGFGERGVRAEAIAERVANETKRYLESGAPIGEHLADQLLLPLALAGSGRYRTTPLTLHAKTQIETIQRFLDAKVEITPVAEDLVEVRVG
jgi:RNA 3'-terminal phosphate cyclase (ATP)